MNLSKEQSPSKLQTEEPSPSKTKSVSLNDFSLLSVLGQGSYSKVALVRKKSNGKIYALKVLKKNSIKTNQQFTKVQAERDILVHPIANIFVINFSSRGTLSIHLS